LCRSSVFLGVRRLPRLMKRIAPILALIALLVVYHAAGVLWGRDAKLYVLVGMLGLYAVLTVALFMVRRRLRRDQPDLAEALDSDSGAPWYWKLLDGALAVCFAFGPPMIVSLVRRQPLSWESEVTGYDVLALAGGVGVYLLGRAYVVRKWQRRQGVTNDVA
jgi:hypothetical protein